MSMYIMYLDRNLKIIHEYKPNDNRQNLKSMYHYNKESCNIVHNSRITKVLFHCIESMCIKIFSGQV